MQYRKFGKLDYSTSILGFGCMRLPLNSEDIRDINEEESIKMIRYAIDNGLNYIDTAYPYHNGKSEELVGKALKEGYREKIKLATKMPVWLINTFEDYSKYLDEQLLRLDTEQIDFYLLHAINEERWTKLVELRVFDFLKQAINEGKIKHVGFSYHGDIKFLKTIIDAYDWSMCQLQYNYMEDKEWENEIKYIASKDIAVVVMEPLLGGKLTNSIPDDIHKLLNESPIKRSPAEWAFKWIYNQTEISLVLSGMSNFEQVKQNIAIANEGNVGCLYEKELDIIHTVKESYIKRMKIKCTECGYCMDTCPSKINIKGIFGLYNDVEIFDRLSYSKAIYSKIPQNHGTKNCIECGKCEKACPQMLPIIQLLKESHDVLK